MTSAQMEPADRGPQDWRPASWKPGDIANGYVLSRDGQWVPIANQQAHGDYRVYPPTQIPMVVTNVNVGGASRSVKISTAEHVMHAIFTVCTLGLWLPVWIIRAITASRRIGA